MRMTRAALRAQEAEEDLQVKVEGKLREQGLSGKSDVFSADTVIYEDAAEEGSYLESSGGEQQDVEREALRDITSENYPTFEGVSPSLVYADLSSAAETKKAKGKKGKKAGAKKREIEVEVQEVPILADHSAELFHEETSEQSLSDSGVTPAADVSQPPFDASNDRKHLEEETSSEMPNTSAAQDMELHEQDAQCETSTQYEADVSESHEESAAPTTPFKLVEMSSKTPKFDPEIHLAAQPESAISFDVFEDSFVDSITSRSPSKLSQSITESQTQQETIQSITPPARHSPQKAFDQMSSPSSQRIEDSVEAIDALEDAIEKFAEDLPVIEALPFESPVRTRKTPLRALANSAVDTPATIAVKPVALSMKRSPAKVTSKTPAKTPARTSTRTPAKAPARTPARISTRTPAKTATPVTKVSTPKAKTPNPDKTGKKATPSLTEKKAAVKRDLVKERVKAIESGPKSAAHRRATSVSILRKDAPEVKTTVKSRHMATKSIAAITEDPASSMSFSNSPVKQATNQAQKRVTGSGTLSTSKPGFVPAKSSKPVTTAKFSLPGEAISAKMKAQREERMKREEMETESKTTFKARPAPVQNTRPSIMPKENKASAARLRQASGQSDKENVAPVRPVAPVASSASRSATKPATANSSVRRTATAPNPTSTIASRKSMAPTSTLSAPATQRIVSLSAGQPMALTKTEAAQQKLKGKEVYGRIKGSIQQQEGERKAKEEAARKARAEAAERGRQASKEWAERQKKKMAASTHPAAVEAAT